MISYILSMTSPSKFYYVFLPPTPLPPSPPTHNLIKNYLELNNVNEKIYRNSGTAKLWINKQKVP